MSSSLISSIGSAHSVIGTAAELSRLLLFVTTATEHLGSERVRGTAIGVGTSFADHDGSAFLDVAFHDLGLQSVTQTDPYFDRLDKPVILDPQHPPVVGLLVDTGGLLLTGDCLGLAFGTGKLVPGFRGD